MKYVSLTSNRQFNMEPETAKERNKTMKKINLDTVKSITGAIISIGVGTVVGNILNTTTPKDAKKLGKILAYIGGACIEGLVVAHAQMEAEEKIDLIAAEFKEIVSKEDEVVDITEEVE